MTTTSFTELEVWKKAHKFTVEIYKLTQKFPSFELYGLTSQLRRAAVSIPANIAEGYVKKSRLDKAKFFNIAQGSLEECRYYLILSRDLNYLDKKSLDILLEEVSKMLNAYIKKLLSS